MKKYVIGILSSLLLLLVSACRRDKVREFIPGTYVNSAGGKYSVADDTLLIVPAESSNYAIERRTGYNRIAGGRKGKREYARESWNAVYDPGTGTLTETRLGKLLVFYPDSGCLMIGKRKYLKLRD